jgi:hypothetical protein
MFAAIQGIGYEKGATIFSKWRRGKLFRIDEINDKLDEANLNIFERLIKRKRYTSGTIFDRFNKRKKK